MPKISVLMCVHNNAPYLPTAIDSILNQTVNDFELIIVDDASSDDTPQILDGYTDPRIIRIRNDANVGLTHSLNRGLPYVTGEYYARMDDDDISLPDRFERQLAYLDRHPDVGMVGGNMLSIDAHGNFLFDGKPEFPRGATDGYLRWFLYWANPIPHVTIMMRREILQNYDPDYNTVEEFELWKRLIVNTRFARLPDVLIHRRILSTSVTRSRRAEQLNLHYQLITPALQNLLGHSVPQNAIQTMVQLIGNENPNPVFFPITARILVEALQKYLATHDILPEEAQQIRADVIGYLVRMARQGKRSQAWVPLWLLQKVSRREFVSRNTLRLALQSLY